MEEEKDELGPKTVFTIKESEIKKGTTQCQNHKWRVLNETEIACTVCPTALIVSKDYILELQEANELDR